MITQLYYANLLDGTLPELALNPKHLNVIVFSLIILLIYDVFKYHKIDLTKEMCKQTIWFQYFVYLAFIFVILLFGVYGPGFDESQFIYFQF